MNQPARLRDSILFWLLWHVLAISALFAAVGLRFGEPPWRFNQAELFRAGVLAAGYGLGAVLLHLQSLRGRPGFFGVVSGSIAGFGIVFFYCLATELQISRFILLLGFVGGAGLLATPFLITRFRPAMLVALALGTIATVVYASRSGAAALTSRPRARTISDITTSLYSLRATYYRNYLPRSESHFSGGGITTVGEGHLVATADGNLLSVVWKADGSPAVERIQTSVPLNRQEFAAAAGSGSYVSWFRAFDVVARETAGRVQVFVSHHHWNAADRCTTVQVSVIEGVAGAPLAALAQGTWRTAFETMPCLPLVASEPGWPFRGMEGGGRMALLDADHLLLTVGDQGFNGVDFESEPDYVADTTASYGKTILVDLRNGSGRPYTIGHRNAQGLLAESNGAVLLTEHGPQGGDELNLLVDRGNYGWPVVTYGTDYGKTAWPRNLHQGRHDRYVQPLFVWVPSIGISSLIRMRGTLFQAWAGDLLVGSLVGELLLRVRLDADRVRLVEPIKVGERVRDVIEDGRGRVILLTDSYSLVTLEPARMEFAACTGCHTMTGGPGHGLGPDLVGVLGRTVASASGYNYSDGLRRAGGVWTDERLDRFLADPQAFAPGTSMTMPGIADSTLRTRIISYLRSR